MGRSPSSKALADSRMADSMITRPQLLRAVERSQYLDRDHPLKRWSAEETILAQDEFKLYGWPDRSVENLLALAEEIDGDPYLKALEIALKIMTRAHGSPFPAGFSVGDVVASTRRAATAAADPLMEMFVANQARTAAHELTGTAASQCDLICWELGSRLADRDPVYVTFYLSELWLYWNSLPRSYALSGLAVPPARDLLRHLADLDGGSYVRLRSLLEIMADMELLIADAGTTSSRETQVARCQAVSAGVRRLMGMLIDDPGHEREHGTHGVDRDDLSRVCLDLAMTLLFLEQYRSGLEHLSMALDLSGTGHSSEIVGFLSDTISSLGLTDAQP
jgi:hypothetical protein